MQEDGTNGHPLVSLLHMHWPFCPIHSANKLFSKEYKLSLLAKLYVSKPTTFCKVIKSS